MDCLEARKYIDKIKGEDKKPRDFGPEFVRHLKQCELCRRHYEDFILGRALSKMPVPGPDPDFSHRVLENAVTRFRRRLRRRVFTWFAAAAAIMAVVFAARMFEFAGMQSTPPGNQQASVIMSPGEEKVINILIEADRARHGAFFTVAVDGDIALSDIPDRRKVQWRSDIVEGNNLLEIPVEMADSKGGSLRVGYRFNEVENEVEVVVEPGGKKSKNV
ncbi:MAG: hypothetical protein ACLFMN_03390 [Desulfobacterales bacterium]